MCNDQGQICQSLLAASHKHGLLRPGTLSGDPMGYVNDNRSKYKKQFKREEGEVGPKFDAKTNGLLLSRSAPRHGMMKSH